MSVLCLNSSTDLLAMRPINQHVQVHKRELNFIFIYVGSQSLHY